MSIQQFIRNRRHGVGSITRRGDSMSRNLEVGWLSMVGSPQGKVYVSGGE